MNDLCDYVISKSPFEPKHDLKTTTHTTGKKWGSWSSTALEAVLEAVSPQLACGYLAFGANYVMKHL
jgi:hypothetical protein